MSIVYSSNSINQKNIHGSFSVRTLMFFFLERKTFQKIMKTTIDINILNTNNIEINKT